MCAYEWPFRMAIYYQETDFWRRLISLLQKPSIAQNSSSRGKPYENFLIHAMPIGVVIVKVLFLLDNYTVEIS